MDAYQQGLTEKAAEMGGPEAEITLRN